MNSIIRHSELAVLLIFSVQEKEEQASVFY